MEIYMKICTSLVSFVLVVFALAAVLGFIRQGVVLIEEIRCFVVNRFLERNKKSN